MNRARVVGVVVALLSAIALGACGEEGEAAAGSKAPFDVKGEPVAMASVELPKSYKFEPAVISIAPGDEVTWTNNDNFPHNVKVFGDNEQTEDLPVGGSASITFDEAGTYYYQCTLHPSQMKGKVLVEDA
jgi:plastocyanin